MINPWDRDDSTAPPAYERAWRDLDLSRRPHLCTRDAAPSYISANRPKPSGVGSGEKPPVDLAPADIVKGRKRSLAKRKQRMSQ